MHIVTKLLVVLSAVLAILLAALSVAYTANADRVRDEFKNLQSKADAIETAKGLVEATSGQARETQKGVIADLEDQLEDAQRERLAVLDMNNKLEADRNALQVNFQGMQAKIDQLTAAVDTQANLLASYRDEVRLLRDNELRYAQREIDLMDRINDVAGQLEVAQETNRALQEQLIALQTQSGLGGTTIAGTDGNSSVRARVTRVSRERGGDKVLASIDAGSNDSLRENQELTIVRNNSFVAKLILENVTLNESVGRIDTLGRNVEVRPGDTVVTSVR
ncbi:MAG: hypothetical protein ACF8GE_02970 [Phycisphaerales bacterium JB043]